jgi:hypothetical protein
MMRLRAGLCGLLLAFLAGCEMIPQILRIEVDDRVIEVKPKPSPTMPAGNEIEPEPEPESAPSLPQEPDDPEPR